MKKMILLILGISCVGFATQSQTQVVAQDLTAMTRAFDLLMAKEEMKDTIAPFVVKNILSGYNLKNTETINNKVLALTDSQTLDKCEITLTENEPKPGEVKQVSLKYSGKDCPLFLEGAINITSGEAQMDADMLLTMKIVSVALQNELDVVSMTMPFKVSVKALQTNSGINIVNNMSVSANIVSKTMGDLTYTAAINSEMLWGSVFKVDMTSKENYMGQNISIEFVQTAKIENNVQTETFAINGVLVTKEEFEAQHQNIPIPAFNDKDIPLEQPHVCDVVTYDTSKYDLQTVRTHIKSGADNKLLTKEVLQQIQIFNTGSTELPVFMMDKDLILEVSTTMDAVRFNFSQEDENGAVDIGRMTAVLNSKVDLTKVIENRVVRITCQPQ